MSREVICGIYKIELKDELKEGSSCNGIYIGQSVDIYKRWEQHKYLKDRENKTHIKLYRAFNKYGVNNFNFDIVEKCEKYQLNKKEKYWIKYYKSFENGYNMTVGGESFGSGFDCINCKLSEVNVKFIRKLYKLKYKEISKSTFLNKMSKKYNVTKTTISSVLHNRHFYDDKYNTDYLNNIPTIDGNVINRKTANKIRNFYKNNSFSKVKVSEIFNVSADVVSDVLHNNTFYNPNYSTGYLDKRIDFDAKGEDNGRSKLTWEKVKNIRNMYKSGLDINKILKKYNYSKSTILFILKNKTWYNKEYDKYKMGCLRKSISNENNSNSKMNWELVNQFRVLYNISNYSYNDLTEFFPVGRSSLYKINKNKEWFDKKYQLFLNKKITIDEFINQKGVNKKDLLKRVESFYE